MSVKWRLRRGHPADCNGRSRHSTTLQLLRRFRRSYKKQQWEIYNYWDVCMWVREQTPAGALLKSARFVNIWPFFCFTRGQSNCFYNIHVTKPMNELQSSSRFPDNGLWIMAMLQWLFSALHRSCLIKQCFLHFVSQRLNKTARGFTQNTAWIQPTPGICISKNRAHIENGYVLGLCKNSARPSQNLWNYSHIQLTFFPSCGPVQRSIGSRPLVVHCRYFHFVDGENFQVL